MTGEFPRSKVWQYLTAYENRACSLGQFVEALAALWPAPVPPHTIGRDALTSLLYYWWAGNRPDPEEQADCIIALVEPARPQTIDRGLEAAIRDALEHEAFHSDGQNVDRAMKKIMAALQDYELPHTINRQELKREIAVLWAMSDDSTIGEAADRILALVRPASGATLTAEEAREIADDLRSEAAIASRPGQLRRLEILAEKLEAAS